MNSSLVPDVFDVVVKRFFVDGFLAHVVEPIVPVLILGLLFLMIFGFLGKAVGLPWLFWHDRPWKQCGNAALVTVLVGQIALTAYLTDIKSLNNQAIERPWKKDTSEKRICRIYRQQRVQIQHVLDAYTWGKKYTTAKFRHTISSRGENNQSPQEKAEKIRQILDNRLRENKCLSPSKDPQVSYEAERKHWLFAYAAVQLWNKVRTESDSPIPQNTQNAQNIGNAVGPVQTKQEQPAKAQQAASIRRIWWRICPQQQHQNKQRQAKEFRNWRDEQRQAKEFRNWREDYPGRCPTHDVVNFLLWHQAVRVPHVLVPKYQGQFDLLPGYRQNAWGNLYATAYLFHLSVILGIFAILVILLTVFGWLPWWKMLGSHGVPARYAGCGLIVGLTFLGLVYIVGSLFPYGFEHIAHLTLAALDFRTDILRNMSTFSWVGLWLCSFLALGLLLHLFHRWLGRKARTESDDQTSQSYAVLLCIGIFLGIAVLLHSMGISPQKGPFWSDGVFGSFYAYLAFLGVFLFLASLVSPHVAKHVPAWSELKPSLLLLLILFVAGHADLLQPWGVQTHHRILLFVVLGVLLLQSLWPAGLQHRRWLYFPGVFLLLVGGMLIFWKQRQILAFPGVPFLEPGTDPWIMGTFYGGMGLILAFVVARGFPELEKHPIGSMLLVSLSFGVLVLVLNLWQSSIKDDPILYAVGFVTTLVLAAGSVGFYLGDPKGRGLGPAATLSIIMGVIIGLFSFVVFFMGSQMLFLVLIGLLVLIGGLQPTKHRYLDLQPLYEAPKLICNTVIESVSPKEVVALEHQGGLLQLSDILAQRQQTLAAAQPEHATSGSQPQTEPTSATIDPTKTMPGPTITEPIKTMPTSVIADPMILMATSGGGITAAVWTFGVLQELENMDPKFPYHIRHITGASGGMVGAAYYASTLRCPDMLASDPLGLSRTHGRSTELGVMLDQISQDMLSPGAQRLVAHDIHSSLFLPFPIYRDRGEALQTTWQEQLTSHVSVQGQTQDTHQSALACSFSELAEGEKLGWRPSLTFSPMLVEDARRLLISNLDWGPIVPNVVPSLPQLPSKTLPSRSLLEFRRLFAAELGHDIPDIRLSTAARMSASFPYVAPAAELPTKPARRVVDAGYYDNYGPHLLCLWMAHHVETLLRYVPRILLLQVNAEPREEMLSDLAAGTGGAGFLEALQEITSPVEALLAMRTASASFRNDEMLALLSRMFRIHLQTLFDEWLRQPASHREQPYAALQPLYDKVRAWGKAPSSLNQSEHAELRQMLEQIQANYLQTIHIPLYFSGGSPSAQTDWPPNEQAPLSWYLTQQDQLLIRLKIRELKISPMFRAIEAWWRS